MIKEDAFSPFKHFHAQINVIEANTGAQWSSKTKKLWL